MPYPVPSKRYDIFQSAFEKKVAEAQKEIESLNKLQGLYTAAREALIAVNLDNDTRLEMYGNYQQVHIRVIVKDGDTMDTFHPLLDELGNALVQRKLHPTGQPAARESYIDREFTWNCPRDKTSVQKLQLTLDVPFDGTDCVEIAKTTNRREVVDEERRAIWHSRPYRRASAD